MNSVLNEQEVHELEKRLREELQKQTDSSNAGAKHISLSSLREQSKKLSAQSRREIEQEVASLFPEGSNASSDLPLLNHVRPKWKKWLVGTAAALLLFSLAPTAVRGAVDIPGLGVWIQQVALKDTGLEWAFEHGYMQGTVAQISKNGVNLRILGVVADPVQTTVIYLIQGLQLSAGNDKPIRVGEEPPTGQGQAGVVIRSVNGEGAASWYDSPMRTAIGLVGTTHTRPLVESSGVLELQLLLPDGSNASLTLEVSREEVSRLSQEYALDITQEVDGITVTVHKAVVTPSQLAIEYTLANGHSVQGSIPEEFRRQLVQANKTTTSTGGSGSYVNDQWRMREIFDRPASLSNLSFVIPALSQTVDVSLEWDITKDQPTAVYEDTTVYLKRFSLQLSQGQRTTNIEFHWDQHHGLWAVKDFELIDASGNSYVLGSTGSSGIYWTPEEERFTLGYTFEVPSDFVPVTLRAKSIERVVAGNWSFSVELNTK